MLYFKSNGNVFCFESDVCSSLYERMTPMTDQEISAHLVSSTQHCRADVEASRLMAYSDQITGSDRFFAEASRLLAMGADTKEVEIVLGMGKDRFNAIQKELPWPL